METGIDKYPYTQGSLVWNEAKAVDFVPDENGTWCAYHYKPESKWSKFKRLFIDAVKIYPYIACMLVCVALDICRFENAADRIYNYSETHFV